MGDEGPYPHVCISDCDVTEFVCDVTEFIDAYGNKIAVGARLIPLRCLVHRYQDITESASATGAHVAALPEPSSCFSRRPPPSSFRPSPPAPSAPPSSPAPALPFPRPLRSARATTSTATAAASTAPTAASYTADAPQPKIPARSSAARARIRASVRRTPRPTAAAGMTLSPRT
eukprot:3850637-Pleurochrysis_carterae.AAC.2